MDKKDKLIVLPALISLSAGLIISIVMIVKRATVLKTLIAVFSVLLGFYVLGCIFRAILLAVATKEEPVEETEELENLDTTDTENEE